MTPAQYIVIFSTFKVWLSVAPESVASPGAPRHTTTTDVVFPAWWLSWGRLGTGTFSHTWTQEETGIFVIIVCSYQVTIICCLFPSFSCHFLLSTVCTTQSRCFKDAQFQEVNFRLERSWDGWELQRWCVGNYLDLFPGISLANVFIRRGHNIKVEKIACVAFLFVVWVEEKCWSRDTLSVST